jgi:hypothetical protein
MEGEFMTMYCTCSTCRQSPAKPAAMTQAEMEIISGAKVEMKEDWVLAHWSKVDFSEMNSIEIHNFHQKGYKPLIGASFYLYTNTPPSSRPKQLQLQGLGGNKRYTINYSQGRAMEIYYKGSADANPAEVTVVLGCGGSIYLMMNMKP